ALERLSKPRLDLLQGGWVVRLKEISHLGIAEIGVIERVEMMVLHRLGRRGEGEEIIDRRRDLEAALIAVPHHAVEPFGIGGAAMNDPADLLAEAADARRLGPRMIVVIDRRRHTREMADRDCEPALELIVIVAVEQIVLAIVLILDDGFDGFEPRTEKRLRLLPRRAGAISEAAPGEISLGEIARIGPAALVDQRLEPRAIGTRLRAEDAETGAALGFRRCDSLRLKRAAILRDAHRQRVDARLFIERRDRARRAVEEVDEVRERVAEEARDSQGDVNARPVEHRHR